MDEPTEGLAPLIVTQVRDLLLRLSSEEDLSVLVVEQNIGVATSVSDSVAIMVNGRINRVMPAGELARDRDLQQRLLGVGRHGEAEVPEPAETLPLEPSNGEPKVFRVARLGAEAAEETCPGPIARIAGNCRTCGWGLRNPPTPRAESEALPEAPERAVFAIPLAERIGRTAFVVGTFDTKGAELRYMGDRLPGALNIPVRTVDLSTSGTISRADVAPMQVATMHPRGAGAVFSGERGESVSAMAEAFARWIERERGIGGVISAGGSGGTSLATAGMRRLPLTASPKIMVSTEIASRPGRPICPGPPTS